MEDLPLKSLRIAQFRGLQELKLEEFSRINLLVGSNNAGKTSVLDALALFCRPLDIVNWRETARGREVKSARTPETEPFKWLFPQFLASMLPNPHSISIYGDGCFPGRRVLAQYDEFKEFGGNKDEQEDLPFREVESDEVSGIHVKVSADYVLTAGDLLANAGEAQNQIDFKVVDNRRNVFPTAVGAPVIDVALISPHTHRTTQDASWYLSRAIQREKTNENFRESVVEILRRIDPDVLDLSIIETGKTTTSIFIKHRRTGQTPIHAFGDGFRRALLIASTIPSVRNGVLLVDELEAALHVSVLDSVLETLRWAADLYNVQVFATTHSLEAVDSVITAFDGEIDKLAAFRLERRDGIHVSSFSGEMLKNIRELLGQDIR